MAEMQAPRPVLQKPPGYRDPEATVAAGNKIPRPPPRKTHIPPSLRRPGKPARPRYRRSCCRRICCIISIALLTLAFLLAVAGALFYLWFQPRLPSFHIGSLQFPQFRVASRPDGDFLDAVTAVQIEAANPNGKIGLWYGGSEATVTVADDDGDVDVGSGSAVGFVQMRRNVTVLRFSASARGILVDDAVGSRLTAQFRSKEIRFAVEVRTKMGAVVGGKSTVGVPIQVVCGAVSLKLVGGAGASPKCYINLLGW